MLIQHSQQGPEQPKHMELMYTDAPHILKNIRFITAP
jgi:hypothetical protein